MPSKKCLAVGTAGLGLALVVAVPGFAKNVRTLRLFYDASLNGQHLKQGAYKIQWESHSPRVTVTFFQDKEAVATAEGRWVGRDKSCPTNTVVYDTTPDGSHTILEVCLAGSTQTIVFGGSDSHSQASPQGNTQAAAGTSRRQSATGAASRIRFVGKPTARPRNEIPPPLFPAWIPGISPSGNLVAPILVTPSRAHEKLL